MRKISNMTFLWQNMFEDHHTWPYPKSRQVNCPSYSPFVNVFWLDMIRLRAFMNAVISASIWLSPVKLILELVVPFGFFSLHKKNG